MRNRTDYTLAWLLAAAALITFLATQADVPVDLNNDRCFESIGGTEPC